jgi:hypothetical protein
MTTTLRTRTRRLLIAAALGASRAATATMSPAHAQGRDDVRISDLSRLCNQAGGKLSGEGSIHATLSQRPPRLRCHPARRHRLRHHRRDVHAVGRRAAGRVDLRHFGALTRATTSPTPSSTHSSVDSPRVSTVGPPARRQRSRFPVWPDADAAHERTERAERPCPNKPPITPRRPRPRTPVIRVILKGVAVRNARDREHLGYVQADTERRARTTTHHRVRRAHTGTSASTGGC